MLTGGAMGTLTFGIGQLDAIGLVGKAILHGVVQGGFAEAQGGDFLPAFAAGAFSKLGTAALGAGLGSMGLNTGIFESIVARGVGAAVIGGTASVIGGGKFQNGAATGAFVYIFNQLASRTAAIQRLRQPWLCSSHKTCRLMWM